MISLLLMKCITLASPVYVAMTVAARHDRWHHRRLTFNAPSGVYSRHVPTSIIHSDLFKLFVNTILFD